MDEDKGLDIDSITGQNLLSIKDEMLGMFEIVS